MWTWKTIRQINEIILLSKDRHENIVELIDDIESQPKDRPENV